MLCATSLNIITLCPTLLPQRQSPKWQGITVKSYDAPLQNDMLWIRVWQVCASAYRIHIASFSSATSTSISRQGSLTQFGNTAWRGKWPLRPWLWGCSVVHPHNSLMVRSRGWGFPWAVFAPTFISGICALGWRILQGYSKELNRWNEALCSLLWEDYWNSNFLPQREQGEYSL